MELQPSAGQTDRRVATTAVVTFVQCNDPMTRTEREETGEGEGEEEDKSEEGATARRAGRAQAGGPGQGERPSSGVASQLPPRQPRLVRQCQQGIELGME